LQQCWATIEKSLAEAGEPEDMVRAPFYIRHPADIDENSRSLRTRCFATRRHQ
jgi:hypothetical protein